MYIHAASGVFLFFFCYRLIYFVGASVNPNLTPATLEVTILNSTAAFTCTSGQVSDVTDIEWFLNGELFDGNDTILIHPPNEFSSGRLEFVAVQLKNNRTTIRCRVHHLSGLVVNSTRDALLIVLGECFYTY